MRRQIDKKDLLSGSIIRHVLRLAIPMIIAFVFVTSYHFVDRFFVSRLGDVATAAIGMAFTVQMVLISVGSGVGMGINSFIARNLGAGKKEDAENGALHAFFLGAAIGLTFAILGLIFQRPLFRLIGAEGILLTYILDYLTIIFLFTPINFIGMFSNSIFQGWGDTVSPMKFMLIGNILNLIFDPLLIFGIGPFPELGIRGAALATGIGRGVSLLYVMYKVFIKYKPTRLSFSRFKIHSRIIMGILQVGLPSSLSQILTSIAMGFVFYILDPFGPNARAAYTIVFTYEMVVFLPAIGISQAVSILTGHNFGARLLDRVDKVYFTGIAVAFGMMLIPAAIIFLIPTFFAGVFARSPEVLHIASEALKITSVGFAFNSIYLCSVAAFQGLGLGRQYLWANIFRLYILLVPATYLGAHFLQETGVWYALMGVNIGSAFGVFLWHRFLNHFLIRSGKIQPIS
ncbi:MAG: MATE family efflux transporter [Calditrichaeota bacterium]|nr:MAG: MATE family efflux transporter [Calditrichota bacterium]